MVRMEKASGVPPNVCVGVLVRPGVCGGGGKVLVWMTGWGKKHVLVRAPRPRRVLMPTQDSSGCSLQLPCGPSPPGRRSRSLSLLS